MMGGPAKKEIDGKMKAVPGVNIFVGGTVGEHGKLVYEPYKKGVPLNEDDLVPELVKIAVEQFGATERRPEGKGFFRGLFKKREVAP